MEVDVGYNPLVFPWRGPEASSHADLEASLRAQVRAELGRPLRSFFSRTTQWLKGTSQMGLPLLLGE